ncbi:MAG: sterol desaturase family protein [Bdellovibrionota bacterium]
MNYFIDHPEKAITLFLITILLCLVIIEVAVSKFQKRNIYNFKDTFANFVMYLGYFTINMFWLPVAFGIYVFFHQFSVFKLGEQWWLFQGTVPEWHWLLLFVLDDLCFYIFHRTSHAVRILWASHVSHHSSEQFNLSVGFRQTWLPFFAIIFWIPLALIGFDPLMIMTMQLISLSIQALFHTQTVKSLGPLDLIFNSPSHHRVHHGTQAKYLDKNFGGVLIIWDRMFGTFQKEVEAPIFGIGLPAPQYNPFKVAFYECSLILNEIKTRGVKETLISLVKPPGWRSHE